MSTNRRLGAYPDSRPELEAAESARCLDFGSAPGPRSPGRVWSGPQGPAQPRRPHERPRGPGRTAVAHECRGTDSDTNAAEAEDKEPDEGGGARVLLSDQSMGVREDAV